MQTSASRRDTATGGILACDAAVIGAGPAGLVTALTLARGGCRTILAGPPFSPDPARPDTRTTALLGPSVQLLRNLGVWDRCAARAEPLRAIRIIDATGRLLKAPEVTFRAEELGMDAFGSNIPNRDLVSALAEAAAGESRLEVIATEGARRVLPGESRTEIRLAEGTGIHAPLVAACDGRRSLCREAAGITARAWSYPQTAIACNFSHSGGHEGVSNEFHTAAGPFTTVPLPGNASSLVWVARPDEAERLMRLDSGAFAREIESRLQGRLGRVGEAGPRAAFPLSGLIPARFAAKRIALVGEAAHVVPPIGAQGLNLGFRDAATLAELAGAAARRGGDPGGRAILERYDSARRGDVLTRSFAIDVVNRTLLSNFLPLQAARGAGLQILNAVGPLRRFVMRQGLAPQSDVPSLMRPEGAGA